MQVIEKSRDFCVPVEIISLITQDLLKNKKSLILFGLTNKKIHGLVFDNNKLWMQILVDTQTKYFQSSHMLNLGPPIIYDFPISEYINFKRIEGYIKRPGYLSRCVRPPKDMVWPNIFEDMQIFEFNPVQEAALVDFSKRYTRLECMRQCGLCGSNVNTVPVWGLGIRVCNLCMKHNLISSAVLYYEYGFDFMKHMHLIAGRVFYFQTSERKLILGMLSYSTLDFMPYYNVNHKLVFFWLPHLKTIMDIDAQRRAFKDKIFHCKLLQSKVRALCIRISIMAYGTPKLAHHHRYDFFLCAKKRSKRTKTFYTLHEIKKDELRITKTWICSAARKARQLIEPELRAMRIMQRAFLSFHGRMTIVNVSKPAFIIDRIKMREVLIKEETAKCRAPKGDGTLFLKWMDMVPDLI